MLRRKLSAGVLRAANPTPGASAIAPICPPSPSRQRARSLASAVLLSSQRNWKSETVAVLKTELKKRGLSQQGNKSALVTRLESAEASSALPPMPAFPTNLSVRGISTTAPNLLPPKSKSKPSSDARTPASEPAAPINDSSVNTTGPVISSQRTEALKPEKIEPERVTVAPGLPESKLESNEVQKLDVQLPKPKAEEEIEQVIPLVPDNFASNAALPSSKSATESTDSSEPKVVTVSGSSTHLEGGPLQSGTPAVEELQAVVSAVPSLGTAMSNVFSAPGNALRSVGLKMPEVHLPKPAKQQEYKADSKPLNEEERRGAWVLAGVIGLGLFLGGPKKEKKSGVDVGKAVDAAKGAAGKAVKGDAQWEKASGAGVVGHGSRKD